MRTIRKQEDWLRIHTALEMPPPSSFPFPLLVSIDSNEDTGSLSGSRKVMRLFFFKIWFAESIIAVSIPPLCESALVRCGEGFRGASDAGDLRSLSWVISSSA